jgi:CHASE3 domain sensor protein
MRDIWERHHQFIGFFVAIVACLAINTVALTCMNHSYKNGQQRILMSYKESLALIDSLQKQNEDALNRVLSEREQTIKKILSDTLVDSIQGLCPKQKDAVRKYVRPYLEVTTRELDVKEKIKSDPNHEYKLLRDEIRSLLQLEFNKIQNEYEALEIWAAILTIVFLIFSFYSFFKTEKLEEDGRKSINRINEMENDARDNLNDLQNRIQTDYQEQNRLFSEAFADQLNEQQNRFRSIEGDIMRRFQDYQNRMEESLNEARHYDADQQTADADETENTTDNDSE